jgi:CheY-like chemotaxis protein
MPFTSAAVTLPGMDGLEATRQLRADPAMRDIPIVAMRTVAGGNVLHTLGKPDAPAYLRERAAVIAPIFKASGVESWTEFAVRFVFSFPSVRATVGSTARSANLDEFLTATTNPQPLDPEVIREILAVQRTWSAEHDAHAEPWSM